ncbi:MAG: TetR/AcrR family transcriptional regulator [Bacteroidales bacterium]
MSSNQETVRDKIVTSASEFFSRFGFHKTTMDEIARKIHKAKGVLYYYFKSKEELYREVVRKELDQIKSRLLEEINKYDDPVAAFENYIKLRFKLMNEARNYHETLRADFRERYSFVDEVREDFDRFERNQLTKIINDGKQKGFFQVSNVDRTIEVVMTLYRSVEIPLYLQNKYTEYKNVIDEMISMIFNGIRKV